MAVLSTDLVPYETLTKRVVHAKSHTEPENLAAGIIRCLQKRGLNMGLADDFAHGSTVAMNTAIERKGVTTALLVRGGTRDGYAIGRGNRPESYSLHFRQPTPFVPRRRTF